MTEIRPVPPYELDADHRIPHTVTFILDSETHFVLTEALSEWASMQHHEAAHDPASGPRRREWADLADDLREQAETA